MAAKKVSKEDIEKARLVTEEFRVSYAHMFKAQGMKGGAPKFSVTALVPKDSNLKPYQNAIRQAKINEFGPDKSTWPTDLESPVTDGDLPKYADKEGYKGHWVIKFSSNEDSKPGLVDENVKPIIDASRFYSGCYARAYVYARVWTHEDTNRQGIHFILDHVQKLRDGKSFSGKKAVESVFAPVGTGEVAAEAGEESDGFTS